ncbi:hypothetical protein [Falsirhodobacter sp. 20TX0035]|uniref:hypothetical protein n=1 Tax=Falsirhodobacter sp. 20TX0035 TaxID=3022019 RepID=UPI002330546A|nr:hypothetical protein [Falsirhodobacter sp. 20TX0035]MDB6454733.1 hypothetical protein [Falsirhodobacter sp. 20TX0035]
MDNVIVGWRFIATMQRRTPLAWLSQHLRQASAPSEVPKQYGIWVPQTKTLRELGIDMDELPPPTMASEIGQIPQDGGDFLPFLVAYRHVVETGEGDLMNLAKAHPAYAHLCHPLVRDR